MREPDLTRRGEEASCGRRTERGTLSRGLSTRDHAPLSTEPEFDQGPVRTCAGCRQTAPRSVLIRVVLDSATASVVVDPLAIMPGRGTWLHPDHGCLEQAERRRALPRSLRAAGPVNTDSVRHWFAENVAS